MKYLIALIASLSMAVAVAQETESEPRLLGAIVLTYCGEPIAIHAQLMKDGSPALLTQLAEGNEDFARRLEAVAQYKAAGGTVYRVELKPGCMTI